MPLTYGTPVNARSLDRATAYDSLGMYFDVIDVDYNLEGIHVITGDLDVLITDEPEEMFTEPGGCVIALTTQWWPIHQEGGPGESGQIYYGWAGLKDLDDGAGEESETPAAVLDALYAARQSELHEKARVCTIDGEIEEIPQYVCSSKCRMGGEHE